ncbi:MAG: glycine cleavage system protein R [Chromatiales bacterium]|nr:glycine cleavage system protein R [Chromatiales bacterium]
MSTHLVISAIGEDHPGIVEGLSKTILDSGCNIEDSRMSVLGGTFAVIMLVTGNWSTLGKLDSSLATLQRQHGLDIHTRRTGPRRTEGRFLPYSVDVVALDQPGIVHQLAGFFSARGINIQEMSTAAYSAAHTATPMFSAHITVEIPADVHIASLREDFLDFCDALNLDGVIEPIKG